jgi:3-deoxy-manno-octulosonate cytidylyltransferase (CMP-KDO synthetase)
MKVLGVIPARFNSSRFPGKPLIDLQGKSMIQRVYEGAAKSKSISKLVVATDDLRIVEEVTHFGGNVLLTSEAHSSGTDRCGEVQQHFPDFDIVINIQGDEPLIDARQLDVLLEAFTDETVQIATLGFPNPTEEEILNPNRIKIVVDQHDNALYFSRSPIPNSYHASESVKSSYPFLRHIGLYAFRSEVLANVVTLTPSLLEQIESLEQLRWMYYGYSIRVIKTTIETPNIDVPADVETVLALLKGV